MQKMICKINIGDQMQQLFIHNDDWPRDKVYWMQIKDMPNFIVKHPEANEVHLFGAESFISKIVNETAAKEKAKYTDEPFHTFILNE